MGGVVSCARIGLLAVLVGGCGCVLGLRVWGADTLSGSRSTPVGRFFPLLCWPCVVGGGGGSLLVILVLGVGGGVVGCL